MSFENKGILYIAATPIGNLGDITLRTIEALKQAEVVFCEDTRVTQKLFNHYEIKTKLKSCHKFSEKKTIPQIIKVLDSGNDAVLVSDAGTPLISDPGFVVVDALLKEGFVVRPLPGASALCAALSIAGLNTASFSFYGFLPKKDKEKKDFLSDLVFSDTVSVFYESFSRVNASLKILDIVAPKRQIVICRELTKRYEEVLRGTPSELLSVFAEDKMKLKGEFVLLIDKNNKAEAENSYDTFKVKDYLKKAVKYFGLDSREAVEFVALGLKLPKKMVYACNLELKRDGE